MTAASAQGRGGRSTVVHDQHALFRACGVRITAHERDGGDGERIQRLRWAFVERRGDGRYDRFANSIGFETPMADLAPLAATLRGARGLWISRIKRPGTGKRLCLRYQPGHPEYAFYLEAKLRTGDRRFAGAAGLDEYDAFRLLSLIGTTLGHAHNAHPRVMLDMLERVACRAEPQDPADERDRAGSQEQGVVA